MQALFLENLHFSLTLSLTLLSLCLRLSDLWLCHVRLTATSPHLDRPCGRSGRAVELWPSTVSSASLMSAEMTSVS